MKTKVKAIQFDLTDGCGQLPKDHQALQFKLQNLYVGQVFSLNEDEVVDFISDECGWCIENIEFED